MAKSPDKLLPGPELDALTAQRVFGWKNVHKHDGALVGEKQDKTGRWRTAKVPSYLTDPVNAYLINERMTQLGDPNSTPKNLQGLQRLIPVGWASPSQRCRAAIKALRKLSAVKPR